MKLTSKGRYAVMSILDLGITSYKTGKPVSLKSISINQNISLSYLEQLFAKLKKENLVNSVRGPGGGYYIAKRLDKISVADIINAVDEKISINRCDGLCNCHKGSKCVTHKLWTDMTSLLEDFIKKKTLSTLVIESINQEHNVKSITETDVIKQIYKPKRFENNSIILE